MKNGAEDTGPFAVIAPTVGRRFFLAEIFFLALVPTLPNLVPYLSNITQGFYGLGSLYIQYYEWVHLGADSITLYLAYRLGKRIEFSRDYFRLGIAAFSGALLLNGFPVLVEILTNTTPLLAVEPNPMVSSFLWAFESSAIPIAGVAIAFFVRNRTAAPSGAIRTVVFAAVGFLVVVLASVTSAVVDALRLGASSSDQLAFLRTFFPTSPYGPYVYYAVYPLLFAAAFYPMGRKFNPSEKLESGILWIFLSGTLGTVVGDALNSYILGRPSIVSYILTSPFLVGSVTDGLLILALGLASASFGFLRSTTPPSP